MLHLTVFESVKNLENKVKNKQMEKIVTLKFFPKRKLSQDQNR